MKDLIYLVCSNQGVKRMTKRYPDTYRGETVVKLTVTVPKEAFQPPTLSQEVFVNDWRDGIELEDVEFRESFITEDEAEAIRERRLVKMREILERQGYKVEEPVAE